jgi:hypothetical protein
MKAYGEVDVYTHVFLTSTLVEDERPAPRPCRFTPGKIDPGIYCIGARVGSRAGLDNMDK